MKRLLFIGGHLDGQLVEVERPAHPWVTVDWSGEGLDLTAHQVAYRPFEFRVGAGRVLVMLVSGTTYDPAENVQAAIAAICKRAGVEIEPA